MKARRILTGISVLLTFGMLSTNQSYAEIDIETIVGIWLFDESEDNIARDSSGNGNDGDIVGTELVDGKFASALKFDGIDDAVTVPHSDQLNLEKFTVAVWVNALNVGNSNSTVLDKFDGQKRNYHLRLQSGNGHAIVDFTSGGVPNWKGMMGATKIDDEQWHHFAATYNMEFERIYIDGLPDGQSAYSDKPDTNTAPLTIGRMPGGHFMNGSLDELIILNEALEEEDIRGLMEGLEGFANSSPVASLAKLAVTWGNTKAQRRKVSRKYD